MLHWMSMPSWSRHHRFKVRGFEAAGYRVRSQLIWDRCSHGMGDTKAEFAPQHGVVWFGAEDACSAHVPSDAKAAGADGITYKEAGAAQWDTARSEGWQRINARSG